MFLVLRTFSLGLVEEGSVDAGHDDGGGGVDRANDEQLLLLIVANETGDGAVTRRPRQAVSVANALLIRRAMPHEL